MARPSMVQLQALIAANFPDNNAGLITPTKLREVMDNFVLAMRPAYGYLSITAAINQTVGTTYVPLVFSAGAVSDVPDFTVNAASGQITRLEAGMTDFDFTIDVEAAANRKVDFLLYKNGVATPWAVSAQGQGAGKPVSVSFSGLLYDGGQAQYTLQVKTDAAATVLTFSNGSWVCRSNLVNTY